jgi:hypothetical protein
LDLGLHNSCQCFTLIAALRFVNLNFFIRDHNVLFRGQELAGGWGMTYNIQHWSPIRRCVSRSECDIRNFRGFKEIFMRGERRGQLVVAALLCVVSIGPLAHGAVTVLRVATTAEDEAFPPVCGNTVVWQDDRDGTWDIYGAIVDGPEVATETEP